MLRLLLLILAALALASIPARAGFEAAGSEPLRALLDGPETVVIVEGERLYAPAAVRRFYQNRHFVPAWTGPGCSVAMAQLLEAIQAADSHGLNPADYHLDVLMRPGVCDESLEALATDAWLALAAHLHGGRLNPVSVEPDWTAVRPGIDLAAALEGALANGDVGGALEALAPPQASYAAMRAALVRYRGYAESGGWRGVDPGPTLQLGDEGPRVAQLRARLALSGFLDPELAETDAPFDTVLEDAVKAFQRRANLNPDGVVGPLTLNQLNRRADDRIAQLRANLERWRWLPDDLGARHIRVNIADFRLEARADGQVERVHNVIVGRLYRRTPVFSSRMTYLVLNPWWETPRNLAVRDKLPAFRRDPGEVERLGFEVLTHSGDRVDPATIDWNETPANPFPYRIRQRPGPLNALGQVKLMFPNIHNVYLHDTPTRGLFSQVRRDFSSGCIRVEDALDLTEWVLAGGEWDRERIDAAVASGRETVVRLPTAVPVHILYLTAVAEAGGSIRFVDDLYGRDPALIAALDAPPPGLE
ncbi:MAG: L,D-transpeptidase family protein [Maricaulaceae bacterium]|nr:L,D-transpeptidase family protein [Maricaulaceae bacterium]